MFVPLLNAIRADIDRQTSKPAAGALCHSSRPALLGTLALAVVVGLIAGRRLQWIAVP